ncbi:hypothetical protein HN51_054084 [Arachis hypogaea]|uniref:G-patch domain-containing protein n=2 Tax=Arachis hypogaea TaxID=3818 RepID=A0A444XEQ5_ARAHY|nr:protein MOS2 [Arachis ipaensis]XP_025674832.1 protein MOS2 [Arachis hypogaea]RYQ88228.1 hypothetical protein Ahy_B09g095546 isoform C [Arachis hypogaea]
MKLSFSIPSKSSSSSNPIKLDHSSKNDAPPSKHFVTEFDPSKPPTEQTATVIPPIQNEWRPTKKMKNLELPITDPNADHQSLEFEHDSNAADAEPCTDMSYGLNLRQAAEKNGKTGELADDEDDRVPRQRPEVALLQKFKDDLKRLPDHQGLEEFNDVPVEGFGKALLAGYGWSEGMGIGRNAKEDVKIVEYKRRTAKEGLGFVGDDRGSVRSQKKEEKKKSREDSGRNDADFVSEKKIVRIIGGKDAGLKGIVVRRIGEDWIVLKVSRSGEEVEARVSVDDVAELGSAEEERCLRKLKELRIRHKGEDDGNRENGRGDKASRHKRERERGGVEKTTRVKANGGDHRKEDQQRGRKQVSWLTSHIRVRVISQNIKGGRLYLKKAQVLDVVGPLTCDISMDESKEIVQGVSQDMLETALPRRGGPVLVLSGKYKGAFGSLVERDLDREVGVVQDADTHELLNVKLEQIAEYIGDPSLLGH